MTSPKRAALYLRVSTDGQTTENQRRELEQAAAQRGWTIVATFEDAGISGAKKREQRPGLDGMLKEATRGAFGVLMAWSVDRLGRSLPDLCNTLDELRGAGCEMFLYQQGIDTATPAGRAMFGMLGVFAEFERSMIAARVMAGLDRVKASGRKLGRPKISAKREAMLIDALNRGKTHKAVQREFGIGSSTIQRVRAAMEVVAMEVVAE